MNSVALQKQNNFIMSFKFGYENWQEFKLSLVGKWYKEMIFVTTCAMLSFWWGAESILGFINANIFSPATAFCMAILMIILDWVSGCYKAVVLGNFQTKLAKKIFPKLIANILMLSSLYWINRALFEPLEIELLTSFTKTISVISAAILGSIYMLSFIDNCGKAGLVHGSFVTWITEKVDKQKKSVNDII